MKQAIRGKLESLYEKADKPGSQFNFLQKLKFSLVFIWALNFYINVSFHMALFWNIVLEASLSGWHISGQTALSPVKRRSKFVSSTKIEGVNI